MKLNEPSEHEFQLIRDFLYQKAGISMKPAKKTLVANRLRKRLDKLEIKSYIAYYKYLKDHKSELQPFLDALTTNETYFMREEQHWNFLKKEILPPLVSESRKTPGMIGNLKFSFWSAAASSGEELYTAAMVLSESLPKASEWNLRLFGTDLNTQVIAEAKAGIYDEHRFRKLSRFLKLKYFEKENREKGKETWRIKENLKKLVSFGQHNLRDPYVQKNFDVIFCRNVFIYFDKTSKERVLQNLYSSLRPGGYLIFSQTESMVPETKGLTHIKPSIYQKEKK